MRLLPTLLKVASITAAVSVLAAAEVYAQKDRATRYLAQRSQPQLIAPRFADPELVRDLLHRAPPPAWDIQDSAFFYYDRALSALDNDDFRLAAHYFGRIHQQFPRSVYAADSWYWEAFALYRIGGPANLRAAVIALDIQQRIHPRARTASDGLTLATRLRGELAKAGDQGALRELYSALRNANECSTTGANVKLAALSALQAVDGPAAMRYLRDIFRENDSCSRNLRTQSVFVLAQVRSPESTDLLLSLARSARDTDVRVEATHWLADITDSRAGQVLERILREPGPTRLKEAAIGALAQNPVWTDPSIFRQIAASQHAPFELRTASVDWLARQQLRDQSELLLRIYRNESDIRVRDAIVTGIASQQNAADKYWLLEVARDTAATVRMRTTALAAAAAVNTAPSELYALYHSVTSPPVREQIITLLGRHSQPAAVEHLIDIVTLDRNAQLRGTSLYWLRQSNDPIAVAFIRTYRER